MNVIGETNSDIEGTRAVITESINDQINADPRFDRVEQLSVDYLVNDSTSQGVGAFVINLSVRLAGGTQVIPISFSFKISMNKIN